jgi:stage II sporulation protein M
MNVNKRFFVLSLKSARTDSLGFILCAALFICGSIIGTVAAGLLQDGASLRAYLADFLSGYQNAADAPNLLLAVWSAVKYHLLAVFLGFSVLGVVFIPALSALRGFFLCFSISAVIRCLGRKGLLLTLSLFGLNTLMTIPCYFILAAASFSASLYLLKLLRAGTPKGLTPPDGGRLFISCGVCFLILLASALIDTYLISRLIASAASHMTI